MPPGQHLDNRAERAQYDLHENDPDDSRYRRFLSALSEPVQARLTGPSRGLDFGCGPGPALAAMFVEAGHTMAVYDRYYADDRAVLEQSYDFIVTSEVVEHLRQPGDELDRLWSLLRPGGLLGIMTLLVAPGADFSRWHYARDPTHICFFSRETFAWLGQHWRSPPEFPGDRVVLFRKPAAR